MRDSSARVVVCQILEPRLLLHAGHAHPTDSISDAQWQRMDLAEIQQLGLEHEYEHYLSARSIEALNHEAVVNPNAGAFEGAPESVGAWDPAVNWPRVAVHATLLPTGKVLFWDYSDSPRLWDPSTGTSAPAAQAGYNIFCSGHNLLADGRVLVSGGHIVNGNGLPDASIYNPFTNTWQRLPNMNLGRWYPTNTTLANGDTLVVSGSYGVEPSINNSLPQVWPQDGSSWRDLTGAIRNLPLYPEMFLSPNGKIFFAGPSVTTRYLDTSGSGAWSTVGNRLFNGSRTYGSAVMYEDGKVLAMGGADPPTASAEVIDLNAPAPAWRIVTQMSVQRRQINATILADGKVLVTGGVSGAGFNNTSTPVYTAELWDPATERFTTMSSMTRPRWYHSTAMLLPDGRILSAGGDNNASAEIFSPPYLFNGARPTITAAPDAVGYGQSFTIDTADAAGIDRVHLIRLSSVTHAFNFDQRINRLSFAQTSSGLQLTAPTDPNLTPPGYYMLFILNDAGVPSVAKIMQVAPGISTTSLDAQAAEEGDNGATITIARTGSTLGAMNVPYTISGTATNGIDYEPLGGVATFADGQSTTTIEINPIGDDVMEGTETIEITLQSGAAHVVAPDAGSVTIALADTPPKVLASGQVYETLPHALRFDFTRDVSASLSIADIVVRNTTTNQALAPDSLSFDTSVNRATFVFDDILPDGNYTATLAASGIADALGTTLAADHVFNFHFLIGDANHDGAVDLADFNILAANFGQSNRNFVQGDFSYDGVVNLIDYNLFAARFGASATDPGGADEDVLESLSSWLRRRL